MTEEAPRSRLTVVLALLTIVAVVGLLVAGFAFGAD